MSISRRAWLRAAGAVTATGLLAAPLAQRETRAAGSAAHTVREAIRRRNLPNVPLVTHEGEAVRFYDDLVKDKFVAINMIYTGCKTSCPLTTANLVEVQKLLGERVGRDIFMYSITLDPANDTVKVLRDFAETFGVGAGWKFLTGGTDEIERLRRALGFRWATPEMDADKDFHTGMVRYGNEPLMLWGGVPGIANPEWVAECILFADRPENRRANAAAKLRWAASAAERAAPKAQGPEHSKAHHHH